MLFRSKQEYIEEFSTPYKAAEHVLLFIDGARLGYGIESPESDLKLNDFPKLCDVFTIGGTKQGALFGEAVVILDETLKQEFSYHVKQRGGLLAKGWLLGVQFETLFADGLYMKLAKHDTEYFFWCLSDTYCNCIICFGLYLSFLSYSAGDCESFVQLFFWWIGNY